jgi:FAD synthetase
MSTAGIIVIGNEILSGKVADSNSHYLCRELRALGVDVERVVTVPDVVEVIASDVKAMSASYDFVFTSGGIGPTHDDVTIDAVAAAFGLPVVPCQSIVERIRRATPVEPNESLLKMAKIPDGASLLDAGDLRFPLVIVRNVYILPGIPRLLQMKFESARDRFRGVPFVLKKVHVRAHESDIASHLNELLQEFPDLMLGSYPRIQKEGFSVLLTLESRDADLVERACDSLLRRLPAGFIHKVE